MRVSVERGADARVDAGSGRTRGARLAAAVGIRAGEAGLAGWMVVLFAVTQAGHGIGANTADTLFLVRFGVEFLPLMILLSGGVVMVATLGYMAGLARVGARRWLAWTLWALAGWLVVERAGIALGAPGIYPVVWLGAQVTILLSLTVLWNAAGEVSTMRQAKRLYPLFASAGIAGGVAGNALTGPLAALLGAEDLLLVHAGLFAAAAVAMTVLVRRFLRSTDPRDRSAPDSALDHLGGGLRLTRTTPLLRAVAGVAFALSALFFLVTFPFSEVVATSFSSELEVAAYLGRFSAVATAGTFLVSFLVTNRLLAKIGVVATLLIVPLVYAAGFALWLASFGLATATVVRGAQWIAVNAIAGTAQSSLFNVLPGRRRSQALAFIAAAPTQLGTMASGALLLLGLGLPAQQRAAAGLVVALLTVLLVLRMRGAYAEALLDAVRQGVANVLTTPLAAPAAQQRLDADAMRMCTAGLQDPRPDARAVAAATLGRVEPAQAAPLIARALGDPEPRVRLAALDAVPTGESAAEAARGLVDDPSPRVRQRALSILQQHGAELGAVAEVALADTDPVARATAAALAGPPRGRQVIDDMLTSGDPLQLAAALHAVAGRPDLSDRDPANLADHPDRRVRVAVASALAGRAAAAPVLQRLLDDPSLRVRTAAATALATHPTTAWALLDVLESGSVRATDAAVRALADAGLGGERFRRWIDAEVDRARYLRTHGLVLGAAPPGSAQAMLADLLLARHERLARWALLAMTTPRTEPALAVVRRGIRSTDPDIRAQALEALDALGRHSLARGLIALLEAEGTGGRRDIRATLRTLAGDHDQWIRALATRCLLEGALADFERLLRAADGDSSPLVRAALSRWTPPRMERTHTLDTVDRVLALHQVPLFSGVDPEDLERVALAMTERRYEPEEVVFRFGDEGDEMVFIVAGEVEVSRSGGQRIRTYGAGQHVGELALLSGRTRSADVVAGAQGLHALVLTGPELLTILEERPEVALAMLATLAERLAATSI